MKTLNKMVYMKTDLPISGKVFYKNSSNEIIASAFDNIPLHVDINFNFNDTETPNEVQFYLYKKNTIRLLESDNINRILQSSGEIKLIISNEPINLIKIPTSTDTSLTSLQYFIYIGTPIIALIVIVSFILTFIYIFKKIKKLKKKTKNKNKAKVSSVTELPNENKEMMKKNSSATTKNHSEGQNSDIKINKANTLPPNNIQMGSNITGNMPSEMPIMYVMPQPHMIQQPMNMQSTMVNNMPYILSSGMQRMPNQSNRNINSIQLNSELPNHYGVNSIIHPQSAQNSHQVASNFVKSDNQTFFNDFDHRRSDPNHMKIKMQSQGPFLRANTIKPVQHKEDGFSNNIVQGDIRVNKDPFSNELRIDNNLQMPSDNGDVPLFEVQLSKVGEYAPGTKFS